jgi:hypothetical protein
MTEKSSDKTENPPNGFVTDLLKLPATRSFFTKKYIFWIVSEISVVKILSFTVHSKLLYNFGSFFFSTACQFDDVIVDLYLGPVS